MADGGKDAFPSNITFDLLILGQYQLVTFEC